MESVWDYPRPPAVVPCERRVRVELAGHVVAESSQALRVLETAEAYAVLRDHVAFYPGRLACFLDDERVRPQDGDFYGGWITDEISGPFKGAVGTLHW